MFRCLLYLLSALALYGASPEAPDVVIIGAGIAGVTTAYEAARGGATGQLSTLPPSLAAMRSFPKAAWRWPAHRSSNASG